MLLLLLSQTVLVTLAALAYFGVRGLTEGSVETAAQNAHRVLRLEEWLAIDWELGLQELVDNRQLSIDIVNWIYIWGHWPVVIGTLLWLVFTNRDEYYELRNAMFISGAIGLVIFASFPVTPPRLYGPEYADTVTQHSEAYRLLQPPRLVNKYAAVPSLHFGWNLLVALTWRRLHPNPWLTTAAVVMPASMAVAVVATANHWTFDVATGTAVALAGLFLERRRRAWVDGRRSGEAQRHQSQLQSSAPGAQLARPVQPDRSPEATPEGQVARGGSRVPACPARAVTAWSNPWRGWPRWWPSICARHR